MNAVRHGHSAFQAADLLVQRELQTQFGVWTEWFFRYGDDDIVVLSFGGWKRTKRPLIRINSTCFAAQYLASVECDCREQLQLAFEKIVAAGAGLLIFLDQDGRGNGHAAVMRAGIYGKLAGCTQSEAYRALGYPPDARSYTGAGVVLRKLGVKSVQLMTNNPLKVSALQQVGVNVSGASLVVPTTDNPVLQRYYYYKRQEGHSVPIAIEDMHEVVDE